MGSLNIINYAVALEATTDASGNAVFLFDTTAYQDRIIRLRADVWIGVGSGTHLTNAACMTCEGIYVNLAGTASAMTAFSGSVNPLNSNSTGEGNAWPQGQSGLGTCTATLAVSSPNIQLIVHGTTAGGGSLVGATVKVLLQAKTWGIQ